MSFAVFDNMCLCNTLLPTGSYTVRGITHNGVKELLHTRTGPDFSSTGPDYFMGKVTRAYEGTAHTSVKEFLRAV